MKKELSSTEYQFIEFIWEHPDGVLSRDIYDKFPQALGTKSAVLHHIKTKGYLKMEQRGKQTIYTALISKSDYDRMAIENNLKKRTGMNSLGDLIASLCGKERLTQSQAKDLYDLIDRIKDDVDE